MIALRSTYFNLPKKLIEQLKYSTTYIFIVMKYYASRHVSIYMFGMFTDFSHQEGSDEKLDTCYYSTIEMCAISKL
jgi:hypothetical protein